MIDKMQRRAWTVDDEAIAERAVTLWLYYVRRTVNIELTQHGNGQGEKEQEGQQQHDWMYSIMKKAVI